MALLAPPRVLHVQPTHSRHVASGSTDLEARRLAPSVLNHLRLQPQVLHNAVRIRPNKRLVLTEVMRFRTAPLPAASDAKAKRPSPVDVLKAKSLASERKLRQFNGMVALLSASHKAYGSCLAPPAVSPPADVNAATPAGPRALPVGRGPRRRLSSSPAAVTTVTREPRRGTARAKMPRAQQLQKAEQLQKPEQATMETPVRVCDSKLERHQPRALMFDSPLPRAAAVPVIVVPPEASPATPELQESTEARVIRVAAQVVDISLAQGVSQAMASLCPPQLSDRELLDQLVEESDDGLNDEAFEVMMALRVVSPTSSAVRPRPAIRLNVRRDLFSTVPEEVTVVQAKVPATPAGCQTAIPEIEFADPGTIDPQACSGAFLPFRPVGPAPPFRSAWRARSYPPPRRTSRRNSLVIKQLPTLPDEEDQECPTTRITRQVLLQRLTDRGRHVTFVPVEILGIPDRSHDCTPD